MARRGGMSLGEVAATIGGAVLLVFLIGGRGKNQSPLLPRAIEDQLDLVVATLNKKFGKRWVNLGLNYLQSQLESALPGVAAIVKAVEWAERAFGGQPGSVKKQAALGALRA